MINRIRVGTKKNNIDRGCGLCYDKQEVKNLKESEVVMMLVVKIEIAIEYSMKTSVCAF